MVESGGKRTFLAAIPLISRFNTVRGHHLCITIATSFSAEGIAANPTRRASFTRCRRSALRCHVTRQWEGSTSTDRSWADRVDENEGGGALLAYGATSIEFASTAVFE